VIPRYVLILLFFVTPVFADEEMFVELKAPRATGPYCGIYSLYLCLDSLSISTEFEDYISPQFVGSYQGSSAKELIDAAEHFGAHAEVFSNLTATELYRIGQPMILHIRSNWETGGYNHWVAFLGFEGNHVRILDYPHPLQNMTLAELLANWDGVAIVVSKEPVDTTFLYWAKLDLFILVAALFSIFYFCGKAFKARLRKKTMTSRHHKWRELPQQSVALIFASFAVGVGYHAVSPVGFLQNPTAVAEVVRRYYSTDISTVTLKELESEMKGANPPLLIDARRAIDFQYGAIPNAVSLPIDSSLPQRQQVFQGVSKSQRIIVYCQSQYCGYADEIAKFLLFNGYENTAVYPGGYREWGETEKKGADGVKNESL